MCFSTSFTSGANYFLGISVKKIILFLCVILVGCANTGVVPMDRGTYLIAKKSPQVGFGPPIGIKGEAYTEANEYCAKTSQVVETINFEQTNSGFGRAAAVSLTFKCIAK